MKRCLLLLVACAKSSPPPVVPSNESSEAAPVETEAAVTGPHAFIATGNSLAHGPAGTCTVGGEAIDRRTRELLGGVTIVLSAGDANEPVITNEKGTFMVHRTSVPEVIHAYYLDVDATSAFSVSWCGQALRIEIDPSRPPE